MSTQHPSSRRLKSRLAGIKAALTFRSLLLRVSSSQQDSTRRLCHCMCYACILMRVHEQAVRLLCDLKQQGDQLQTQRQIESANVA